MIFRRYVGAIFSKRVLRIRSLAFYVLTIFTVYLLWQFSQNLAAEEYIYDRDTENRFFVLPATDIKSRSTDLRIISAYFDDRENEQNRFTLKIFALALPFKHTLHCCVQSRYTRSWICLVAPVQVRILTGYGKNTSALFETLFLCRGFSESIFQEKPTNFLLVDPTRGQYSQKSVVAISDITYISHRNHMTGDGEFSVCVFTKRTNHRLYNSEQDIVEFIELSRLLGAKRLVVYSHTTPVSKLLTQSSGISSELVQWGTPSGEHSTFRTVYMNDCMYRNIHRHEHLLFLHLDEMLVPSVAKTWSNLIESLRLVHNSSAIGSYNFQIYPFYDETTNSTKSYTGNMSTGGRKTKTGNGVKLTHLPRAVRFRSREITPSPEIAVIVEPDKVDYISGSGSAKMLPGFSDINVPVSYGSVHRFMQGHKRLKGLVVDSSMDQLVSRLLRALHVLGYSTKSH